MIICTPEYIKGVPGVLKNALEWLGPSGELDQKPVAVITASLGGEHAHDALLLNLSMLHANVFKNGSLHIPAAGAKFDHEGEVINDQVKQSIQTLINGLIEAINHA